VRCRDAPIPRARCQGAITTIKNNFQSGREDNSFQRKPPRHQALLNHMRTHKSDSPLLHRPARHIQGETPIQRQQLMGPNDVLQPSVLCPGPRIDPQCQRHLQRTESEKVFKEAQGVGKVSNRIAKIYSDGTDIFADADQFIAHHRRLAPPGSIMRQRAETIAKTNPGMKAAEGWLHGLIVPLEYVEALFEHIPQIIDLIVFRIAPLVVLRCVTSSTAAGSKRATKPPTTSQTSSQTRYQTKK
jgi:hypothetical protein